MSLPTAIIARGYFPAEFPPPFTTLDLATYSHATGLAALNKTCATHPWTRPMRHSLARHGGLRRALSVPNPVNFLRLTEAFDIAWLPEIEPLLSTIRLASSQPILSAGPRAFAPRWSDRRSTLEALARSGCRYLLVTDIQNFFPSIYTHSIPWVLHGKAASKAALKLGKKAPSFIGDVIDKAIREGQDGQTMGLPIGPDTSWVLAEALLARVEQQLVIALPRLSGHRFNDDFSIATRSQSDAETAMDALQSCLAEYELSLNPLKTSIQQLPVPIEDEGIAELRLWKLRPAPSAQRTDLIAYFDRVAELVQTGRGDPIASYAVARLRTETILPSSWHLLEALVLQLLVSEPACAKQAAMTLSMLSGAGHVLSRSAVSNAAETLILRHAPLGHTSEVAWALWLCLAAHAPISAHTANAVSSVDDSVVALLALHAKTAGLVTTAYSYGTWEQAMTVDELDGPRWLLSYEARQKAWLPSMGAADHRVGHPLFEQLSKAGVSFYDSIQLSLKYLPPSPVAGGSSGGSPYSHIFT